MKIKHLILCGAMGLMMVSCSTTKQSAINQLEDFSYELRDHSRYYNVDDWEKAGKKFVSIRDKISKHEFDYTPEEKTKIGRLEGYFLNINNEKIIIYYKKFGPIIVFWYNS